MAKTQIKNYVFKPGLGAADNLYPTAYSLLNENKTFIQKEAAAWIADKVEAAAQYTPTGATYAPATGVLVLTIGTHNFNVGDAIRIATGGLTFTCGYDNHATEHSYPRASGVPNDLGTDPFYNKPILVESSTTDTVTVNIGISSDTSEHIFVSALDNAISDAWWGYTYNTPKCERDIGYNIDAYLKDLRYGGNENTYNTVKYYWDQDVAQIDGDRQPEIQTYKFIKTLIQTNILANVAYSASNTEVSQTIDVTKTAETGTSTIIGDLVQATSDVITTGISAFPTFVPTGVGTIKIQGRYDLDQIILITNVTSNDIIYNFSAPTTGGLISLKVDSVGKDTDFVKFLETTDAITTITLNYNTSGHNSTDELQIFIEKIENGKSIVTTRPYDFGTDAIERPRAAMPVSMLDADFEYGLQPTKWAAISTMRGYPSIYEVPGTDTPVLRVETDASAGSDGIGQSLITVTTVGTHGFESGAPITLKALEDGVPGAARAEGSFVINTIPTNNTFTYYAKSKVGTVNPTTLSTTYTQLRQAAFYTGASISTNPVVDVISNGFNGTMISELDIATGSTIIPFDGPAPGVGAPLTNANIPTGSQVTGVNDTSAGGGTYVTPAISDNVGVGENRVFLDSTAGIVNNLAADRGDGTAIYVNNVDTSFIDFNDNFTSELIPNVKTYTGITGTNDSVIGTGATFDITQSGNVAREYTVAIDSAGADYKVGDRIIISGSILGGQSPDNDLLISITGINATGAITTFTFEGAHWDGTLSITSVSAVYGGGSGTGAAFDLEYDAGAYTSVVVSTGTVVYNNPTKAYNGAVGLSGSFNITKTLTAYSVTLDNAGEDYVASETFTVLGTELGGASPANDATVTIDTVGAAGEILTLSVTGTANDTSDTSADYIVNDRLLILGSNLGGIDSAHDVYITVDAVDGTGAITSVSYSGTPPPVNNTYSSGQTGFTTSSAAGTGVVFNVTQAAGLYTVSIISGGSDYVPTETITVTGDKLGGATPANDLTITIDNVDASGTITTITESGTSSSAGSIVAVSDNSNIVGNSATFDVTTDGAGGYTTVINTAGSEYGAGQVLTISGTLLSGESPANDLTITIDTVDALITGAISTISDTGTSATPGGTYTAVDGTNEQPVGTSASFDVAKNFTAYDTVTVSAGGSDYKIGDRIILSGNDLDGVSTDNDIILTIATVGGTGDITTLTYTYTEAEYGSNLDLISTILMTEATTATIAKAEQITYEALPTLEVTFPNAHGLVPGSTFITTINSDDGTNNHNLAAGSFLATEITAVNKLRYLARSPGNIDTNAQDIKATIYPRPDSFFIHRPFDGGVQLGTGGPQHGAQAIRQSKKYIRYQSGKGIMYTTGALFAPSYDLRSLTAAGTEVGDLITIETDDNDHGVQVGGTIRILGVETPGYNSGPGTVVPPVFDYTVESVLDERRFTVRAQRRLGATTAVLGFGSQMSVVSWHGATVRSGIFDDQNGIFWEFDGTQISVVQRTGTRQLAGSISLAVDDNLVTGSNTRFEDQLKAGDRIVIKGMTHVVSHVNSQTEITVTPDWRGVVDITGTKANLIVDKKTKQKEFNLDRLDGTGPSGYDIDIAKMQMIGIQYSWYGAGFIDFMLRGADGNFIFAHRMRNSNVNTEAFMRSGNLPVRYEVSNEGPSGKLAAAMDDTQTTLELEDGSFFPHSGTVYIDNEIITFTGRSSNHLTGLTRSATFNNFQAGATRSYTAGAAEAHTARTGVVLISQSITPLISHWGSAFITDGGFDEDRGYIFSYAETGVEVSTTKQTAFMIRLSPSVSNAIIGDLGERELLNRAQLLLQSLEITSDGTDGTNDVLGGIVVEGVLNPQNYPLNPDDVGWQGLSGLAQGGQPSFAQIASGGSVVWSSGDTSVQTPVTTQIAITASVTAIDRGYSNGNFSWDNALDNNRNYFWVTNSFYNSNRDLFETGVGVQTTSGNLYPSGTTITAVAGYQDGSNGRGNLRRIFTSNRPNQDVVNSDRAITLTRTFKDAPTNRIYFNKTSFDTAGVKAGTTVLDSKFSAGTAVSNISLASYNGIEYYDVTFNQSSNSDTITAGTTAVTFDFTQPPFAQPGETVFSFIAVPGERATVDFSQLKELTNTPLGGRGTYPNGPDVLAINVYKVEGATANANIILNWGEAQA